MIRVGKNLIDKIQWGQDNIIQVYKGDKKIWPSEIDGILMNQNITDPSKIISGQVLNKELVNIINNTHWYCGKLTDKGMLICQVGNKVLDLNTMTPGNLNTFYNGVNRYSNFSTSGNKMWSYGDVFIKFPSFSVIKEVIDDNIAQLKWAYGTEIPGWIYVEDNWLIGLSSCGWEFNKLQCHENVHDEYSTFEEWKERLAQMNDSRYSFMSYWQRCIFTHLYWSIYGTTHDVLTGSPHYFLGIDAFCSSWIEFMDGIVINDRVPVITKPDGSIRIGHTLPGSGGLGAGGWISKIWMTPYLDIIPKELNASKDTGFCSYVWTSNSNGCIPRVKAGMSKDDEIIGVGYDRTADDTVGRACVRLTYHGDIIETKDVEEFKRVKPINGGVFYNDETGKDEYYDPYLN